VAHDPNSFKKIAVLTGLTVLIGGAEISNADAATTTPQTDTFNFTIGSEFDGGSSSTSESLSFAGFNASLGTLTEVDVEVNSSINSNATSLGASVTLPGQPFASLSTNSVGSFIEGPSGVTTGLSGFIGSTWSASLALSSSDGFITWCGGEATCVGTTGLTVTYDYTPVSATPLPATLPLFASGLAGLGITTWRRRRKQTAKK
jgi:hypothetical protein